jgi:cytochrome c oxidase subunit IV
MGSHLDQHHHIIPLKTYLGVFFGLLVLTVITVVAAQFDFGAFNTVVAMLIASVKAFFVLAYFMHLKYDDKVYLVGFLSAIFFLVVMYFFSVLDILTRVVYSDVL